MVVRVCVCVYVVTSVFGYLSRPEEAPDPLLPELEEDVSCLTWLLAIKIMSSTGTTITLRAGTAEIHSK